jgi:hypothetical protein
VIIRVDPTDEPAVRLLAPEDLGALKLVLLDRGPAGIAAVSALGERVDDEHVRIAPEVLVGLAGDLGADPGWTAGFTRMIAYATEHGWVDGEGRVRVHVEGPDA